MILHLQTKARNRQPLLNRGSSKEGRFNSSLDRCNANGSLQRRLLKDGSENFVSFPSRGKTFRSKISLLTIPHTARSLSAACFLSCVQIMTERRRSDKYFSRTRFRQNMPLETSLNPQFQTKIILNTEPKKFEFFLILGKIFEYWKFESSVDGSTNIAPQWVLCFDKQQDSRLASAFFSPDYKYFDQLWQTVKNKTTVLNLVFKEFLETSIPPLFSVLHSKGYHNFLLNNFCLTLPKIS